MIVSFQILHQYDENEIHISQSVMICKSIPNKVHRYKTYKNVTDSTLNRIVKKAKSWEQWEDKFSWGMNTYTLITSCT